MGHIKQQSRLMTVAPERKQVTQLFQLIEQPIEGICSAGPRLISVCCLRPSNACGCSHELAQNDGRALALKIESATCPSNLTSATNRPEGDITPLPAHRHLIYLILSCRPEMLTSVKFKGGQCAPRGRAIPAMN
jgi:hypothetical protein